MMNEPSSHRPRAPLSRQFLLTALLLGLTPSACGRDAGGPLLDGIFHFGAVGRRGKPAQPPAKATQRTPRFEQPAVPLGLNLGAVNYYATAIPFVDAMKMADEFQSTNATFAGEKNEWDTHVADKIPRDARGYPLEIPFPVPGLASPQILRASVVAAVYPGVYTLLYDGEGELDFPSSPVQVQSRTPGRIELLVDAHKDQAIFVAITRSSKANHIRNIRLLLPGFAQNYEKQVFHPMYLSRLSGVSTLRFMDWGHTNASPIEHWADRAKPDIADTSRGVALEDMVDLANRVGADAWFCVPHKADDHYVEEMAKLIKARLDPRHRAYIEYSNELWNGIFEQVPWAAKRGCAEGLNKLGGYTGACSEDGARYWAGIKYQARRSGQIFRIFDKVFAEQPQRVVRVLAGQSGFTHESEKLIESFEDPGINPARGQADVLAVAPYAGGNVANEIAEAGFGANSEVSRILDRLERDVRSVKESTLANKQLATAHGLSLVAYEGGQHLVAYGAAAENEQLVQNLIEAQRSPRMRTIYHQMLDAWFSASDNGLMVLFNFAETPSKYGSWGLLESQDQRPETAPKYQAFLERLQKLAFAAAEKSLKSRAAGTSEVKPPAAPVEKPDRKAEGGKP